MMMVYDIYLMNGSWLCNELASLTFDYENAMMITIGILYYDDNSDHIYPSYPMVVWDTGNRVLGGVELG